MTERKPSPGRRADLTPERHGSGTRRCHDRMQTSYMGMRDTTAWRAVISSISLSCRQSSSTHQRAERNARRGGGVLEDGRKQYPPRLLLSLRRPRRPWQGRREPGRRRLRLGAGQVLHQQGQAEGGTHVQGKHAAPRRAAHVSAAHRRCGGTDDPAAGLQEPRAGFHRRGGLQGSRRVQPAAFRRGCQPSQAFWQSSQPIPVATRPQPRVKSGLRLRTAA